jgi:hypothetical protein
MRMIRSIVAGALALVALAVGAAVLWRRFPRTGTRIMNTAVNPGMIRRGLAGGRSSEIGKLEHIGRRSGIRRVTLVHPEPTADGFRIMVPLGRDSQWARNVLAAGHCRIQVHDLVYELDEPAMVPPAMLAGLPPIVQRVEGALGFQYLLLRRFSVASGALDAEATDTGSTPLDVSSEAAALVPS